MKKGIIALVCVVLVAALAAGGWYGYGYYQNLQAEKAAREAYLASHVTIDGTDYEVSLTELDLSGKPLTEWQGLERMGSLRKLDLQDTGISAETYDSIRALLPECEISWSVPFQGQYLPHTTTELTVTSLTAQDVQQLVYLPQVSRVKAEGCRDYDALQKLMELRPNIEVSYDVEIGSTTVAGSVTELEITVADLAALEAAVPHLPQLQAVHLTGELADPAQAAQLQKQIPDVALDFNFTAFDREFNSLDTFIDLSRIVMKDTQEVERIIPLFRDLQQIDMLQCGLNNKTMDALNKRYPDTKIVWTVYVYGSAFRTDAQYCFPGKYSVKKISSDSLYDLRYCTDMRMIDLGHYGITDISFVEFMPNLEYLLLCQIDNNCDLTPLSKCTKLKNVEIFGDTILDLWPLTNLSNLEDLNLCYTPVTWRNGMIAAEYGVFDEWAALREMTWLERLWMAHVSMKGTEGRNAILERHQDTFTVFQCYTSTGAGWRHCRNYYDMRDMCDMIYFVH